MINPIRIDPSRTGMLRRKFQAEINRRLTLLRSQVVDFILGQHNPWLIHNFDSIQNPWLIHNSLVVNYPEQHWSYTNDAQKLAIFQAWLQSLIDSGILRNKANWLDEYIMEGYQKGLERSFNEVRPMSKLTGMKNRLDFYKGTKAEFLSSSFMRPVNRRRVELLVHRSYTELQGVTSTISQQLARILADGMIQGRSPREIATQISTSITSINRQRAQSIARTETVRAHAEGQLDGLESLGVPSVGVAVEWSTAGDAKVCPKCRAVSNIVLKVDEARGLIPHHPNCRCAWIPSNVGEDKSNQVRTRNRIAAALKKSYGTSPIRVSSTRPKQVF